MNSGRQTTLSERISLTGIGVHSGAPAEIILHPADPGTGLVFVRNDKNHGERWVEAKHNAVSAAEFQTVLADEHGPVIATVEHVLAALRGLGIDNVIIEVDGPEVPILDGSASAYVHAISEAGISRQSLLRRYIKILKPVRVSHSQGYGEFSPSNEGFCLEISIDFQNKIVGHQKWSGTITPTLFARELSRARTFGFMRDVAKLWSQNFAKGASLDNTIVVSDDRVLNPEGLRYRDEFVRHKALDAIGDLALAGAPILGCYTAHCPGHKLNAMALEALLSDQSAWTYVTETVPQRERVPADLLGFIPSPAFAPELH